MTGRCLSCRRRVRVAMDGEGTWRAVDHGACGVGQSVDLGTIR